MRPTHVKVCVCCLFLLQMPLCVRLCKIFGCNLYGKQENYLLAGGGGGKSLADSWECANKFHTWLAIRCAKLNPTHPHPILCPTTQQNSPLQHPWYANTLNCPPSGRHIGWWKAYCFPFRICLFSGSLPPCIQIAVAFSPGNGWVPIPFWIS